MLTRALPHAKNAAESTALAMNVERSSEKRLDSLLWASVLFNLALCFVDTNFATLGPLPVMGVEALILGAALLVPLARGGRIPGRMDFLLLLLFANFLLLSILRQSIDPKLFRDVAIIPIFVLLGMASTGAAFHRRFFWLLIVILAFAIWEAISVESFVSVFSVSDYFAHTRGTLTQDWTVESGLYLSSVRPETRFLFANLPIHRLSSVFLEPVSLGNYVIIATIWLAGFWREISRPMKVAATFAILLLLIGSDSRMASLTCVAILIAAVARKWLPSVAPVLMAPIAIAAMFLTVHIFGLRAGNDDFPGRIAYAVEVFRDFGLDDLAGISLDQMATVQDAGFAYIIISQSLIVALIIWGSLFLKPMATPKSRFIHLAVALYLALNLTVSWSLFSIKTAALLWFLLGRAIRDDQDERRDAVADPPAPEAIGESRPRPFAGQPAPSFKMSR